MRVLWYCMDWSTKGGDDRYGGVGYYRVMTPAKHSKHDVTVVNKHYEGDVTGYDLVIMKQATNIDIVLPMVKKCKTAGVPLVMDLDDNYWDIEPHNPSFADFSENDWERIRVFTSALSFCDAVIVSTEPLKKKVREVLMGTHRIDMPVYVIPNTIDSEDFTWQKPRKEDDVKMFWMGSVTHDEDLRMVMPAINRIFNKHKNVSMSFAGGIRKEQVTHVFADIEYKNLDKIKSMGGTPYWNAETTFPEFIGQHQFDIAIAPLQDTPFTVCKSHIKWMESATTGACVVASKVYPYYKKIKGVPTIEHNKTGIIADDWFGALDEMIRDGKKRRMIARQGQAAIKEQWDIRAWSNVWDETIEAICTRGLGNAPSTP